jgi:hypothetical protein
VLDSMYQIELGRVPPRAQVTSCCSNPQSGNYRLDTNVNERWGSTLTRCENKEHPLMTWTRRNLVSIALTRSLATPFTDLGLIISTRNQSLASPSNPGNPYPLTSFCQSTSETGGLTSCECNLFSVITCSNRMTAPSSIKTGALELYPFSGSV